MVTYKWKLNPEKVSKILKDYPYLIDILKTGNLKKFYYELQAQQFGSVVISQFTKLLYESGVDVIKKLGGFVPEGCFAGTSIENIPDNIKSIIGPLAFYNCPYITEAIIPDGVTEIGNSAFRCCSQLKKVVIPKSVTEIGKFAFANCYDLEEVTLPEKFRRETLEYTGNHIFSNTNKIIFNFI